MMPQYEGFIKTIVVLATTLLVVGTIVVSILVYHLLRG